MPCPVVCSCHSPDLFAHFIRVVVSSECYYKSDCADDLGQSAIEDAYQAHATHTDWCALPYLIPFNHGDLFPIGGIQPIRHIDVKSKQPLAS